MISTDETTRGRKKDEVRVHFHRDGKISICMYCNKKFSSPVSVALKGHLAGDGFERIHKTTACPSVPNEVKEFYINHMHTRKKRSMNKRKPIETITEISSKSDECKEYSNSDNSSNKRNKIHRYDILKVDEHASTELDELHRRVSHSFFDSKALETNETLDITNATSILDIDISDLERLV
jgi:hypothetical protein